jgi:hypothetical protein
MICHFAIFVTTLPLASLADVHISEPKEKQSCNP